MTETVDDRIEAYLDGTLSGTEAAALERDLVDPRVARAFAEAVALRELLRMAPPIEPPPALVARLECTVLGEPEPDRTASDAPVAGKLERLLPGARLSAQGLSLAFAGPADGARHALAGLAPARAVLRRLDARRRERAARTGRSTPKRRAWWRRVIGRRS